MKFKFFTLPQFFRNKRSHWAFAILLGTVLFIGCRKLDTLLPPQNEIQQQTNAKFFNVPANASPAVKRIAAEIERRNKTEEFITAFAGKNGYPIWDKILIQTHAAQKNNLSNSFLEDTNTDSSWLIPLVLQDSITVNGFIQATITPGNDSLYLSYKLAQDYKAYSFISITGAGSASGFALLMMQLDNLVFGYKSFKITDKRLFATDTLLGGSARLLFDMESASANNTTTTNSYTTGCTYVTVLGYRCGTPNYAGCIPNCDALEAQSGVCVFGRCFATSSTYTTCSFDPGEGGGGSGTGTGTGGTPGHGTGGGGLSHPYPCPNNPNQNCPPPGGPIGWEPEDINESPCDKMKPVKDLVAVNQVLQSLWLNMNSSDPNAKREFGVELYNNAASQIEIGPLITNSESESPSLKFTFQAGLTGIIHTHPNFSNKILPIFSPEDILTMYHTITSNVANSNAPITNYSIFFSGVLNWKGDSYFMVIDNIDAFKAFAKKLDFDNFFDNNVELEDRYRAYGITHNSSVQDTEKFFLQFLQNNNCGVKVLKTDQNFSQFSELNLQNGNVVATPCP